MANTINLQNTAIWAAPFLRNQPQGIGGNDPALTSANMVMQTILGEPFKWRWNRNTAQFSCTTTEPQYTENIPDFGFFERGSVQVGSTNRELSFFEVLSPDSGSDRPTFLSTQNDDNQGNVTFQVNPPPDEGYTVSLIYQKKPPIMTSLASLWAPLPDEFMYIYNWGYLMYMTMLTGDSRFPIFRDIFLGHLLGKAQGLTVTERNIFLGNWTQVTETQQASQLMTQAGVGGRTK